MLTYSVSNCGPTSDSAGDYHDLVMIAVHEVVETEEDLADLFLEFFEDEDSSDTDVPDIVEVDDALTYFKKIIHDAIEQLNELPEFDHSNELKNSALQLMRSYQELLDQQYTKAFKLVTLKDNEYSSKDDEQLRHIWNNEIDPILEEAIERFSIVQENFANKYQIIFTDDDVDDEDE